MGSCRAWKLSLVYFKTRFGGTNGACKSENKGSQTTYQCCKVYNSCYVLLVTNNNWRLIFMPVVIVNLCREHGILLALEQRGDLDCWRLQSYIQGIKKRNKVESVCRVKLLIT